MNEYKDEADALVAVSHTAPDERSALLQEAQVQATLHLAEQQRVANLLTAFTTYERWPSRSAATSFSAVKEALAAELREALGLS